MRVLAAILLTVLALGVPLAAWHAVGSREAEREEALRLAARLEALRVSESKRPFTHYQNLYHDPKGAYEGIAVVPSPLAEGPADPLILAYFQVDAAGRLTLPSFNEELPELNRDNLREQQALKQSLLPLAASCRPQAMVPAQRAQERQVQTLDSEAWDQQSEANAIYRQVKGGGDGKKREGRKPSAPVEIQVGELAWAERGEALLALREVETPSGSLVQGFQVDTRKAGLVPVSPGGGGGVLLPLEGVSWCLAQAPQALRSFQRRFWASAGLASLAGLCLVALVWQSDRLASQRAQFAASAAHELRTPLAGLRMYGEMLAEGLGDPSRGRDYARRIADEAERLGRVVANVLGFSRLERRSLQVRPVKGDLAAAVREAVERQRPPLEASGVKLELIGVEGVKESFFDPDALAQILQNLLDNAEKYTRGSTDRRVTVSLNDTKEGRTVSVSDRGPGLPKGLALFRPFSRGGSPDAPAGLGLGLALSRALARAQGGDLVAEKNIGTRIVLSLCK